MTLISECDIAVVGAGAAGLAAGIFAAERATGRARVVLLDGAERIGAKILVSGGSRCNVTHDRITLDDYFAPRHPVRRVLAAFDESKTVDWFADMGVALKREPTGKLFPVADSARAVLDALIARCGRLGAVIQTGCRVHRIDPGSPLKITHSQGELLAHRVILATGGRSLPKTGSDGEGWRIVRELGHTVTPTHPALVPLVLADSFFHADLSGLACEVELATFADDKLIDRRTGSLLWTHFGISGPVVMDASRFWTIAHAQHRKTALRCSFMPGRSFADVEAELLSAATRKSTGQVARALLNSRLADALLRHVEVPPEQSMGQLGRDARRRLVHAMTELPLPVIRDRGWNYAEVTAGGVPLSEIDTRNMASRIVPGVHLVGEMLDCDGRIGGFNFQWAWATGHIAGCAAAEAVGLEA